MVYILYALFFISCILLIASVLLQPGKTDAGALFTSNISSTAFQPRGAQTILSKITIAAATIFMLSALFLAMPALTGDISVLQTTSDAASETAAPASATNTNSAAAATNTNAGANLSVESNTAVVVNASESNKVNVVTTNSNNANQK